MRSTTDGIQEACKPCSLLHLRWVTMPSPADFKPTGISPGTTVSRRYHSANYAPLKSGCIRLLKTIESADDDTASLLCYSLSHFKLSTAPPYAALSYCWGSSYRTHRIRVHNRLVAVNRNLHHALLDLEEHASHFRAEYLWVDAICVDQATVPERDQQMQLMQDIYRGATIVFAYLGEADRHTAGIFRAISDSQRSLETKDREVSKPALLVDVEDGARVLKADYWQRTWIMQGTSIAGCLAPIKIVTIW